MKAALIYEYGSPDVFRVEETETPKPLPNDVLIEVHAASVNPVDYKIRKGGQRGAIRLRMPAILGMDVSGTVAEVGSKVTDFKVGDEVYSSPTHRRPGTYAEYVAIDQSAVALKPKNLSHQEAASIPLVGLTAWDALVVKRQLEKDQKAFIQAGSGGVGSFAIQLAKHFGAYVSATCSTKNVELVKSLGADQVIDYKKENYLDIIKDYDLVLEALGEPEQSKALQVLKKGGLLAALCAGLPENTKYYGPNLGLIATGLGILKFKAKARLGYCVGSTQVLRASSGAQLAQITELLEAEIIKPLIDKVFPLAEIADAHRHIETGRTRGKIVIAVK